MGGSWCFKPRFPNQNIKQKLAACSKQLHFRTIFQPIYYVNAVMLCISQLHPKGQTQPDPRNFNIMPFLVGCADSLNNDRVVIDDVCMAKLPPRIKENGWTMCQRMRVICTNFADGLAPGLLFFDGEGGNFSSCQRPDTAK